jgi:cytoskeletal protein RodZ
MAYDYFRWCKYRGRAEARVGSFGDKFRKERERQGIKLEEVSNSTKISSRMLGAIENERFDQLPGGVFNKGFIRAYAKHLGMDEEDTVAAYLAALNQLNGKPTDAEPVTIQPDAAGRQSGNRTGERPADRRKGDRRSSSARTDVDELPELQLPKAEHVRPKRKFAVHDDSGIGWRVPLLLALLLIAGTIWWSRSRNGRNRSVSSASAAVQPPAATSAPVGTGLIGNNAVKPAASAAASHATSLSSAANPAAVPTTPKAASHPALPPSLPPASPPSSPPSSPQSIVAVKSSNHVEVGSQEAETGQATAPATKPRANLTLVIHALENSWIAVTADGQPVIHETLIAPAHASIRATKEIVVRAGNSAGVTFSLNGEEFSPPGSEGEVKTFMFDADGMHETLTPPPADPAR